MLFLTLPIFAQSQYTESESITCGNGVCEVVYIRLNIGEEKDVEVDGETYNFKLLDIIEEEHLTGSGDKYYTYEHIVAVNGEEMTPREIPEMFGGSERSVIDPGTNMTFIEVRESDVDGCAVPDCAFRVELDLYEKWNLVPTYLLTTSIGYQPKGTCELQDFLVIYGYDPVEREYVELHTYGKSFSDLESSFSDFAKRSEDEKILMAIPYNSVWVYSLTECELVAELLTLDKSIDILLLLEQVREQGLANFAPGWNFWMGSTDMEGKSFDEIEGSCTIEEAYTFDASSQSWKALTTPPGPAANFIFKVKDACMFGYKVPEAPALPD